MNKKIILILITVLILITCLTTYAVITKNNNQKDKENELEARDILENKPNSESKILVVYFSKTGENYNVGNINIGNTALMASYIKEYLNADSFEIVPVNKYSDDYTTATEEAMAEKNNNARPAIKNELNNLDEYDTVFIGYPIWWGDLPMIVYTFLENYDLEGKTVIPFNTHEGSGSAGTYSTIENLLPNSNVNTKGLAIFGTESRTETGKTKTINWLKELGY